MGTNLQHEDLLIKLRAKLNEQKIKLWEPPFLTTGAEISQSLEELASKYATEFALDPDTILQALCELQVHSVERSKANEEFKETGVATFRVKTTIPGEKPRILKLQKKLDALGSELITAVADNINVAVNRVKLIFNGKVIKPSISIQEQGVKNGVMLMALVMAATPEEVKKEDSRLMEMKAVCEDATLLSEYVDNYSDDDEYMRLEDQSGKAVELPAAERRSLLVGLALHERGRAAAKLKDYTLALLLFLEADSQFRSCRSSLLSSVDNWALLQLDISWCYLCLSNMSAAPDAAARLDLAENKLKHSYGEDRQRVIALKGNAANERVLFMRLYLLQGIVAYHQNKRAEAKTLLEKAENELSHLKVDEESVVTLMELGWSRAQARCGLRSAGGHVERAHYWLQDVKAQREKAREAHAQQRQRRLLGVCMDGSLVNQQLVEALISMGYTRRLAVVALRNSNNHVAEAVRMIQEQPELLEDTDESPDDTDSLCSDEVVIEPDMKLVNELVAMGYDKEEAKTALRLSHNHASGAVDRLVAGGGRVVEDSNPSTSAGGAPKKKQRKHGRDKKKRERELALRRLTSAIKTEDDDYLDASLVEEEEFLAQYKSLL